jgi:hypothetical protein
VIAGSGSGPPVDPALPAMLLVPATLLDPALPLPALPVLPLAPAVAAPPCPEPPCAVVPPCALVPPWPPTLLLPPCIVALPLVPDDVPAVVGAPPLGAVLPVLPVLVPAPLSAPPKLVSPVLPDSTEPLTHDARTPTPINPNNEASPCRKWIIARISYHRANGRARKPMPNRSEERLTIVESGAEF